MEETNAARKFDIAYRFVVVLLGFLGFVAVQFYVQARYGQPVKAALVTPTVLHFQGNVEDPPMGTGAANCTGNGATDVSTCDGPFLTTSSTFSAAAAGRFESTAQVDGTGARSIYDPQWVWYLSAPTRIGGTMTIDWWASCSTCNAVAPTVWTVRLFADNVQAFETNVNATPGLPGAPSLVSATIQIPEITANTEILLHIDPAFVLPPGTNDNFQIYYDSSLPCPGSATAPCDSKVTMPVLAAGEMPPTPSPTPAVNASRTSGNITFSPATVADIQRTEAEPLNFIDKNGAIWATGPYGASTGNSFIQRSTDGGNQYNVVSSVGIRPNPPPGGGDTDITGDDQGNIYFTDLEGVLNELDCSVSNDGGNTWRKNFACVQNTAVDRQWIVVDNGLNQTVGAAGAADNTVFLTARQTPLQSFIYSSPGSTGPTDLTGGVVFTPAAVAPINDGAPCGKLRFDAVSRNLYLPCDAGNRVKIAVAHVNPGQRDNLVFTTVLAPVSPGGGDTSELFPMVATDKGGNLYAAWVDHVSHKIYYAYSTDFGNSWSPVTQVSSGAENASNIFVWTEGGNAGNVVVTWLGTSDNRDSDAMTSWLDPLGAGPSSADDSKWYVYSALITNAATLTPNIEQNRVTRTPSHYGQICAAGTACAAQPGSDRIMAEYHAVYLDSEGAMRFIFNDTTSQFHGAHLYDIRQLTGPTAIGTTINRPLQGNPSFDPAGDAQYPHYVPSPGPPGANQPGLDFLQVKISQPDAATLRFHMRVNSVLQPLAPPAPPPGKTNAYLMMRFQALSKDDTGTAEAYRVFYVGAESINGGAFAFFAGSPDLTTGCTSTQTCKLEQYPAEITTGLQNPTVSGDTMCVDIPLSLFGANRPIGQLVNGRTEPLLYNVTGLSGGRNNATTDIYADVDATKPFNYTLGSAGASTCSLSPTAAVAPLAGRITDANGESVEGVNVSLVDSESGETRAATTSGKGRFVFEAVPVGRVYVLTPSSKRYNFTPASRVISHMDVTENADFTADRKRKAKRARVKGKAKN
jgi:hypothetical protein